MPNTEIKEISSKKKLLFKIITIFIPILFLFALEGLLRLFGYGYNLNLFNDNPKEGNQEYMMVNPLIGEKYFQKFEYTSPANDIFLKKKETGSFRVFAMGSSTVLGFPYEKNLMFSRILHQQLEDNFPDYKIEVINTAITAINSYTLLDYANEIIKQKPDAILIYAGHNEFYGAFGAGSNETISKNRNLTLYHIALMDLKTYQLLRNIIGTIRQSITDNKKEKKYGTLMKRIVANESIILYGDTYNLAIDSYKKNMDELLAKFKKNDVPVFYSELVSNVKDLKPFKSIKTDSLESAIEVYYSAQKLEKYGDFEEAKKLYNKAKDLDCIRFRASEDINDIIRELAVKHKANLVPMVTVFQNNSPHQLIGDNLITEHLHPNIAGNFLMAEAFYDAIIKSKVLSEPIHSSINWNYIKLNWGYTDLDSLLAYGRVASIKRHWPFIPDAQLDSEFKIKYHPKSQIDSIFSALKSSALTLDGLRLDLAKKYETDGQLFKALKEFEAIMLANPYIAKNYHDVAGCFLQLSDLPLALKHLQKSLEYEESLFANFVIADIYFIMGDYNNSTRFFEKSYSIAPNEIKLDVLIKLYTACVYANKMDQAKSIAIELTRVNASQYLKIPQKSYVFTNYIPYQTNNQITNAKILLAENEENKALALLESSLNSYDSHIANRLIGEIYLKRQNFEKAAYFYKKTYNLFKFDPLFLQDYALIYVAKNDHVTAKKCMQEIKNIDPDFKFFDRLNVLLQ